jgi:hypothetical protein
VAIPSTYPGAPGPAVTIAGQPGASDGLADGADVITADEIAEVTENYRTTAGFSVAALKSGTSLTEDPHPQ